MKPFNEITQARQFLSIRKVEDYEVRLKSGEKKRELEKNEVIRSLQMLGFDSMVSYKENGQPYLEKYPTSFLSISHSKGWFAIYIASYPVGIDIEVENPKIIEGTAYFLNEREQQFSDNLSALHLIWGAKEAFYKLKEGTIADLKNEATILSIEQNNVVKVEFESRIYEFEFFQENGVTLVLN